MPESSIYYVVFIYSILIWNRNPVPDTQLTSPVLSAFVATPAGRNFSTGQCCGAVLAPAPASQDGGSRHLDTSSSSTT